MPRTVVTSRILDNDLVGTHHVPDAAQRGDASGVGVLLLNAGPAPRAGNSDLSVHIGDRLASNGVPVFRFDLPGLGDSCGPVPRDLAAYWRDVLAGRNDAATQALIPELKRRFEIHRMIVGGLCAAVVPALRGADREGSGVDGLILLEPEFRMAAESPPGSPAAETGTAGRVRKKGNLRRALSLREWLHFLTGESRIAAAARPLRPFLLRALERSVGHSLPQDTNLHLCMRWRGSLGRGTHSLAVVAEGQISDRYVTRILDSLPSDGPGTCALVRVPGTNHILTEGRARDVVVAAIEQWVTERFGTGSPPS